MSRIVVAAVEGLADGSASAHGSAAAGDWETVGADVGVAATASVGDGEPVGAALAPAPGTGLADGSGQGVVPGTAGVGTVVEGAEDGDGLSTPWARPTTASAAATAGTVGTAAEVEADGSGEAPSCSMAVRTRAPKARAPMRKRIANTITRIREMSGRAPRGGAPSDMSLDVPGGGTRRTADVSGGSVEGICAGILRGVPPPPDQQAIPIVR
jgi:hypothetical protein